MSREEAFCGIFIKNLSVNLKRMKTRRTPEGAHTPGWDPRTIIELTVIERTIIE